MQLKQQSYVNISNLLQQHTKLFLKSIFISHCYSMFTFCIENRKPFVTLTKNCPELDKSKSIVFRFSVYVIYKSAVSTVQKSNYVGYFNFRQWMFPFAHLFSDISIKSTEMHF